MKKIEDYELYVLVEKVGEGMVDLPTPAHGICRSCPHRLILGFEVRGSLEEKVNRSDGADRVCTQMGAEYGINIMHDLDIPNLEHDDYAVIAVKVGAGDVTLPCSAFLASINLLSSYDR